MADTTTPISAPRTVTLLPSVALGAVIGVVEVMLAASIAGLLFGDVSGEALTRGIGFAAFAAAVTMAWIGWRSETTSILGGLQATIAAVVAGAVVAGAGAAAPGQGVATAFMIVAVSTVLTGIGLFVAGRYRLAQVIRFVPVPVVGGFLAGTGWLAAKGAVSVMVGLPGGWADVPDLFGTDLARLWIPGLVLGVAITIARRQGRSFWVLPGLLVVALAVFWISTLAIGSRATAEAGGWLLGPLDTTPRWIPFVPSDFIDADWLAVLKQTGGIVTAVLVALVGLLFNVSSLEIINEVDLEANDEFRWAGLGNLIAGVGGGPAGYHHVTQSVLARTGGGANRTVALTAAGVCLAVALVGGGLIELVPRFLLGGFLFAVGAGLLWDWLIVFRSRLPVQEYGLVVVIVVVVAAVGFLPAVALGMVAAAGLFAFSYSKTDAVKHRLTASEHSSRVTRPAEEASFLREAGKQVTILELQGFLFFGSAYQVLQTVRARLESGDDPQARFAVVDFRRVRGIDSSAVLGFVKLQRLVRHHACTLVLTSLRPDVIALLRQGGFEVDADSVEVVIDLDHGLEWCEDELLRGSGLEHAEHMGERGDAFGALIGIDGAADRLQPYVERKDLDTGDVLIQQGDPPGEMYLVVSGGFTTQLELADGTVTRLARVGPGSIVGEVGLYTGENRTASVIATEPSTVDRIGAEALTAMEHDDPELASAVNRCIVGLLADRLARSNDTVRALLD